MSTATGLGLLCKGPKCPQLKNSRVQFVCRITRAHTDCSETGILLTEKGNMARVESNQKHKEAAAELGEAYYAASHTRIEYYVLEPLERNMMSLVCVQKVRRSRAQ